MPVVVVVVVEEEAPGVRLALVGQWVELAMVGAVVVRGVATGPLRRTGSDAFCFCFLIWKYFKCIPLSLATLFSKTSSPLTLTLYYRKRLVTKTMNTF